MSLVHWLSSVAVLVTNTFLTLPLLTEMATVVYYVVIILWYRNHCMIKMTGIETVSCRKIAMDALVHSYSFFYDSIPKLHQMSAYTRLIYHRTLLFGAREKRCIGISSFIRI